MWLILVDAMSVTLTFTTVFTLAVAFALCADVVAEHGAEDKILLRGELVQRTGDDEPDSLQTLAPSEIHVQILLSCGLQHVWDALTLQSFNGLLTIFLITGKQHHVAHTFVQFVDVVHQNLNRCGNCCRRSCHRFFVHDFGCKIREKKRSAQYLKTSVLSITHLQSPAKAD